MGGGRWGGNTPHNLTWSPGFRPAAVARPASRGGPVSALPHSPVANGLGRWVGAGSVWLGGVRDSGGRGWVESEAVARRCP